MTDSKPGQPSEAPTPWHTVKVGGWLTGFQHRVEAVDQGDAVHRAQFLFPDRAISYVGAVSYVPRSDISSEIQPKVELAAIPAIEDATPIAETSGQNEVEQTADAPADEVPHQAGAELAAPETVSRDETDEIAAPGYGYPSPQVPLMGYGYSASDYGAGPSWYGVVDGYGDSSSTDVPDAGWGSHSSSADDLDVAVQ